MRTFAVVAGPMIDAQTPGAPLNTTRARAVIKHDRDTLERVLRDAGVANPGAKSFRCPLPAHDDEHPSCGIHKTGGGWALKCFGCGWSGDVFALYQKLHGCEFREALEALGGTAHKSRERRQPSTNKHNGRAKPTESVFPSAEAAGAEAAKRANGEVEWIHAWNEHHSTVRMRLVSGKGYRPISRNGSGWLLADPPKPYPLANVQDIPAVGVVYVVEGLPPLRAGWSIDLPTVTSGSATSASAADWTSLRNRDIVILPDNDPPGFKYAEDVATKLTGVAKSIRIVRLPDLPEHGDLAEFIEARDTMLADDIRLEIEALVNATAMEQPAPTPGSIISSRLVVSEAWPAPIPLGFAKPPPFPLDALDDDPREFVEAIAASVQVDPAVPAMLLLGAGAAVLSKRVVAHVRGDHYEQVNMFVLIVLPSGERKSAVFRVLLNPISTLERTLADEQAGDIAAAATRRDILEGRIGRLKRDAGHAADPTRRAEYTNQITSLVAELRRTPERVAPRLICDDVTPEALARLLALHDGVMTVASPEGGIVATLDGRYSRNGELNCDVFLKGYSGDDIRVDRVNKDRPPEYIRAPHVNMVLAVQPAVLSGLGKRKALRGVGLLSRFCYCIPESRVGHRAIETAAVPDRLLQWYGRTIEAMARLPIDHDRRNIVRFDDDALTALTVFAARIETDLRRDGRLAGIKDWGAKAVGHVVRYAAVLHGIRHAPSGPPHRAPIEAGTAAAAVQIGEYLIDHALAAFNDMGADPAIATAKAVLSWVRDKTMRTFTRRECHRRFQGRDGVSKASDLDAPLLLLLEHGFLRRMQPEPGKGGRPPEAFVVNPIALEG